MTFVVGDAAFTSETNASASLNCRSWDAVYGTPEESQCVAITRGGEPRACIRRAV